MIHEGALHTEVRDGEVIFIDQRGHDMPYAPDCAATGHDLEELDRFLDQADLHIDPSINPPKWDGTPMNLADSLSWMFIADQTRPARGAAVITGS